MSHQTLTVTSHAPRNQFLVTLATIGLASVTAAIIIIMFIPINRSVFSFQQANNIFYKAQKDHALITGVNQALPYALYPDGMELVFTATPNGPGTLWAFASPVRLTIQSPYYKKTGEIVCQIIFARQSLLEAFKESCVPLHDNLVLRAFANGRQRLTDDVQNARSLYEKYKSFNLVD